MTGSNETIEKMDKLKLIYDMKSIPNGVTLDQLYNIMIKGSIVIWDSYNGGEEPKLIEDKDLSIYDVGFLSKEQFEEKFNTLLEEE